MKSFRLKNAALVALLAAALVVVGVLVWPEPRLAMANVTYAIHATNDATGNPQAGVFVRGQITESEYYEGFTSWPLGDFVFQRPAEHTWSVVDLDMERSFVGGSPQEGNSTLYHEVRVFVDN